MADTPFPLPTSLRQTDVLIGDGRTTYGPFGEGWGIFDDDDVDVNVLPVQVAFTVEKVALSEKYSAFTVTFARALTAADTFQIKGKRRHRRELAVTRGGAIDGLALELELSKQSVVMQELDRDIDDVAGRFKSFETDFSDDVAVAEAAAAEAVSAAAASMLNALPNYFDTFAAAQAAAIPAFVKEIKIGDRDGAYFVPWIVPMNALPVELQGYAYFDDVGARRWMLKPGQFFSKNIGCKADGVTDDTIPWLMCSVWMNEGWSKHLTISQGVHIAGRARVSNLPASAWKTDLVTRAITTDLDDPDYDYLQNACFVGLRNFRIDHEPGGIIKNKDASVPSVVPSGMAPVADGNIGQTNNRMSWGVLNFMDCQDYELELDLDCNRDGQTHTSAIVSGSVNHGVMEWGDCKRRDISKSKIRNTGTLQTSADKAGDCIYSRCGVEAIRATNCTFENWGRWALVIERGFPTPGNVSKSYYEAVNCYFKGGAVEDGAFGLGGVDIESWNAWNFVRLQSCIFEGSNTKISFGSSPDPFVQECAGAVIDGCSWDFRTYVSATVVTDTIIGFGAGWGTITVSSVERKRRIRSVQVTNNTVIANKGFGNFLSLSSVQGDSGIISGNRLVSDVATADNYNFISTSDFGIAGNWLIANNVVEGKNFCNMQSWQETFDDKSFTLTLDGNVNTKANKSLQIVGPNWKISATGTVTVTAGSNLLTGSGTSFTSDLVVGQDIKITATGESYRVASIFTATSARLTANVTTPAAGSAYTRAAGFIDVKNHTARDQSSGTGSTLTANGSLMCYRPRTCFMENSNAIAADVITPGEGVGTVLSGATTATVYHLLRGDPTNIQVSLNDTGGLFAYAKANANLGTFTVNLQAAASANVPFTWSAINGNGA
jgi:hypothetical protein